jgi:hypothetical protein
VIVFRRIFAVLLFLFGGNCLVGTMLLVHDVHRRQATGAHVKVVPSLPISFAIGIAIAVGSVIAAFLVYPWKTEPSTLSDEEPRLPSSVSSADSGA